MQKYEEPWVLAQAAVQTDCPHVAGGFTCPANIYSKTSIVWHTLRTGETIGVCFNCNRKFRETDFDYWLWRNKPSLSLGSSDNGENPANKNWEGFAILGALEPTGLDKLSDEEIKFLFNGVRTYRRLQKALEKEFSSPEWSVG